MTATGSADIGLPPVLVGLRAAIDALIATDPAAFADGDSVIALTTELARLDAVACRQADEFRFARDWVAAGAQSSPAWVATRCRVPKRIAQQQFRLGRFCRRYDLVAAAFESGSISIDHVDVLHAACNRSRFTRSAFNEQEAMLVEWAATLRFDDFRHTVDH